MEVVFIYDAVYPWVKGGVEKRIYEIGKRLSHWGFRVKWLCAGWWGKEQRKLEGIELIPVCGPLRLYSGERRSISSALSFALSLAKNAKINADVLDCQVFPYLSVFPFFRRRNLVLTWHEYWGDYWKEYLGYAGLFGRQIERIVASLDRKMVAVSETTARNLLNLGVKNVEVIPNGIDFEFIRRVEASEESLDVVFAGRLIKEKGADLLIKAMKLLPDYSCLIVGEGPEKASLIKSAPENVKFAGFMNYGYLIATLKSAKVFVLPSRREGFGIAALEANACGLPVVTINHPMNAVVEIARETGFIASPSPQDIAEKIKIAMESRKKMRRRCVDYARKFDWSVIAKKMADFYDNCGSSD
ncbi:glycosyltransferase family 4 protein [Archaeoglobus fulgidus]|uniref:Glycosyltransferase family 1 protein n=4 Tax=Archaeoglobus fulgidus TaxID=2234 RepID=O29920_ARCFU|nr:glycosyltransferase family 4 protein [Archaeoglobus fulgidus]AAB90909.1 conserved hypothetical protein [Archaeoglobus fulgidus DSM 4304]AIG97148.1 Glycosyltransferase [Archaeoglobus fulgidus DSM 8774]